METKIQVDMVLAAKNEKYREDLDSLAAVAVNLRHIEHVEIALELDLMYDRISREMKAIEAFYNTKDVLTEYSLGDWIMDLFQARNCVDAVQEYGLYRCELLGGKPSLDTIEERWEVIKTIKGAFAKIPEKAKAFDLVINGQNEAPFGRLLLRLVSKEEK